MDYISFNCSTFTQQCNTFFPLGSVSSFTKTIFFFSRINTDNNGVSFNKQIYRVLREREREKTKLPIWNFEWNELHAINWKYFFYWFLFCQAFVILQFFACRIHYFILKMFSFLQWLQFHRLFTSYFLMLLSISVRMFRILEEKLIQIKFSFHFLLFWMSSLLEESQKYL